MAVDDVSIANRALTLLSADRIGSFTENSESARKVAAIYEDTRDALLEDHNWNFARTERTLSLLSDYPILDTYASAYQLPSDCIRVLRMQDDEPFDRFSDRLYTNSDSASIEYIARITDPTKFTPGFVRAFAAVLAADLCYGITQNATMTATAIKRAEDAVKLAKLNDGQEGTGAKIIKGDFITARQSSGRIV